MGAILSLLDISTRYFGGTYALYIRRTGGRQHSTHRRRTSKTNGGGRSSSKRRTAVRQKLLLGTVLIQKLSNAAFPVRQKPLNFAAVTKNRALFVFVHGLVANDSIYLSVCSGSCLPLPLLESLFERKNRGSVNKTSKLHTHLYLDGFDHVGILHKN